MPIGTPHGTLDYKQVSKVTFVGASSNTVIDTTTGSLGVGVDGNGPTSNLHVVGHTRLEGDINMLHTANTASIKLNSNVVTEFPRSKKLIKYPRVVLNSASQDGYVVTASTDGYVSTKFHRYDPFRPFVSGTDTNSANGWHSGPPDNSVANNWDQTFDTSGYYDKDVTSYGAGGYAGTSIAGIESEWLKLELPHKIVLSHFYYQQRDGQSINYVQAPRDFRILGSNDDVNWDTIQMFTDQISLPEGKTLTAEASKGYKYLAFVVTRVWANGTNRHLTLKNLEYYGVPEYDPEAHGIDVTIKSKANVPNTDWLEVYYDGQDYTDVTSTVNDKVGTATNATITNTNNEITFDSTYKAWTFGGTDTRTSNFQSSALPSTFSGDQVHSVALWFKCDIVSGDTIFSITQPSSPWEDNNKVISVRFSGASGGLRYLFWSNDLKYDGAEANITKDIWYHLCVTYSGGGGTADNKKLYLNGNEIHHTSTSGSAPGNDLALPSGSVIRLGSRVQETTRFFGSIANFRLFNRVITQDEVWQLYAYQKEDFGHSTNNLTLKAGRLGIGTSEPKAALDVRGRITREYNPGEIIETIQGKANGRYVTVQSGRYLLPNVGDVQDLTSTHTTITGSNFEYTPPPGTTRVIYEFWCFLRQGDNRPICHFQGRVDGTIVNDSRHTYRDTTTTGVNDPQKWIYNHMCISIGEVSSDNIAGGQVATWNGPRTIDFTAREYSDTYEGRLHKTNHWDGGGSDILVRPTIKITAIA